MNPEFGHAPNGATDQNTWALGFDWLLFNPGTVLQGPYSFWDSSTTKPQQYRTTLLATLAQQKSVTISSLQLIHNLAFAANESEPAASQLEIFNAGSYIRFTVLQKTEDRISVREVVPYELINIGGTITGALKQNRFFNLPTPLEIPAGGDIVVELLPLAGYTLAATGVTNPHIPNGGLTTSDRGFYVRLAYFGAQARPVA